MIALEKYFQLIFKFFEFGLFLNKFPIRIHIYGKKIKILVKFGSLMLEKIIFLLKIKEKVRWSEPKHKQIMFWIEFNYMIIFAYNMLYFYMQYQLYDVI